MRVYCSFHYSQPEGKVSCMKNSRHEYHISMHEKDCVKMQSSCMKLVFPCIKMVFPCMKIIICPQNLYVKNSMHEHFGGYIVFMH